MYSAKKHLSIYLFLLLSSLVEQINSHYQCGQTNYTIDATTGIGPKEDPNYQSEKCEYKIEPARPNTYTILEWTNFNVADDMPECTATGVTVYIGCLSNEVKVTTFCSRNSGKPFPIISRDGCIRIVVTFSNNESITTTFSASYKTYSKLSPSPFGKCIRGNGESGLLASPNWPNGYDEEDSCNWYLNFPQKLYFLIYLFDVDMDVPLPVDGYTTQACSAGQDLIVFKFYRLYYYRKRFCEIGRHRLLELYDKKLSISMYNFKSNQSSKGRGFVLGYMKYGQVLKKKTKRISPTSSSLGARAIVGIVAVTLIAYCIFVIYVYNKYHSRRKRAQEFTELNGNQSNMVPMTNLPTQTSDRSVVVVHTINSNNDEASVSETTPMFLEFADRRIPLPKYSPPNYTTCPTLTPLLQQPLDSVSQSLDGVSPPTPLYDRFQNLDGVPPPTPCYDETQNLDEVVPSSPLYDEAQNLDGVPPLTPSYDESQNSDAMPVHSPSPMYGEAPPSYEDALRENPVG